MQLQKDVTLRDKTTFRIGGPAAFFVCAESLTDIENAIQLAENKGLRWMILGEGSNVLMPDSGFGGVVIAQSMKGVSFEERGNVIFAKVAAGENWDAFVELCAEKNISGIENLSGIPGTVGATPIQNVGAYGVEVKDVIEWVEVYNTNTKKVERLGASECAFDYRNSLFKHARGRHFIVLSVCYRLSKEHTPRLDYKDVTEYFSSWKGVPTLADIRRAIIEIRARKFPDLRAVGTAGSFFKNPIIEEEVAKQLKERFPELPIYPVGPGKFKLSLAWILDHVLSLRGVCVNDVCLFEKQPLVLINKGEASAYELKAVAHDIAKKVKQETGIEIEPEVTIVDG